MPPCRRLAATVADRYTLAAAPEKRAGRIFIDYLRNGRGTTAIGAWSPRARAEFPIAAPVSWRQVEHGIGLDAFTMDKPPRGNPRLGSDPTSALPKHLGKRAVPFEASNAIKSS